MSTTQLINLSDALTPIIQATEKRARKEEEKRIAERLVNIQEFINYIITWRNIST